MAASTTGALTEKGAGTSAGAEAGEDKVFSSGGDEVNSDTLAAQIDEIEGKGKCCIVLGTFMVITLIISVYFSNVDDANYFEDENYLLEHGTCCPIVISFLYFEF